MAERRGPLPNVLFILTDDQGPWALGCSGNDEIRTPAIDRIAATGVRFEHFLCASPVCSPSRVAVMSGQFPARFSVHQHFASVNSNKKRGMPDWLDPEAPMLPRILKEAGYKTGHFGK